MNPETLEQARRRVAEAARGGADAAALEAALERAQTALEGVAAAAAGLEAALPERVEAAVRDGVSEQARPLGRQLAEVRGLVNHVLRRLDRLEGQVGAERHARIDDLALLVDLVASGWQNVDQRLAALERHLGAGAEAAVYRIEERRPASGE